MKICFIANWNSPHTKHWIDPILNGQHQIKLLSYTPVVRFDRRIEIIDLTKFSNIAKIKYAQWGIWINCYLRNYKPHILHALQIPGAGWLGRSANYHPFVISAWGSDLLIEPKKSWFRKFLVKNVLHSCDGLTVPTNLLYTTAVNIGISEDRIHLIPWGIDTENFYPDPDDRFRTRRKLNIHDNERIIFCPRGIKDIYSIDILLAAFAKLVKNINNIKLLLLRFNIDNVYMSHLEEFIQKNSLDRHVIWIEGQNDPHKMANLYRASDVIVSIPISEGFGFSVYEAMACGCPTVITNLDVFNNLIDRLHTSKVPPRDVEITTIAIEEMLKNIEFREIIVKNSLSIAFSQNISSQAEKTLSLYNELANTR